MPFVPNELVLTVQLIDAGFVLTVEYITPFCPAATSVVPSVSSVLKLLVPADVLAVQVVPFVDVATAPEVPTPTQALICGTHFTTLIPVTDAVDIVPEEFVNE